MEKELKHKIGRFSILRIGILYFIIIQACCYNAFAQEPFTGAVLNAVDSIPIEGVSIHIKNRGAVAKTNSYGQFQVMLPPGTQTISFTHIGYVSYSIELSRLREDLLTVYLTPLEDGLEEVVVNTGIQQLPRERVTGSFIRISNEQLNEQIGPDLLSRLEGVANSFSIDRSTNGGGMMIRGLSTLTGPREPLIILDNFPYDGNVSHINPNDVESITIMKDAAAASIWGARAGNGVIVITTKQAKWNNPLQLSFRANTTIVEKPNLFYAMDIRPEDLVEVEQYLFQRGYFNANEQSANRPALSPVVEMLIANRDGQLDSDQLESGLIQLRANDIRREYADHMYRIGLNQQYSLSAIQGGKSTALRISASLDENVNHLESYFGRVNVDSKFQAKVGDKLSVAINSMYIRNRTKPGKTDIQDLTTMGRVPGYTALANDSGEPLPVMKDYRTLHTDTLGGGGLLNWDYIPLIDDLHLNHINHTDYIDFNTSLSYRLFDGLNAHINYRYSKEWQTSLHHFGEESYYARNYVNRFTQISGDRVERIVPEGAIIDQGLNETTVNNLRAQVGYNNAWPRHSLDILVGSELRNSLRNTQQNRAYGVDEETLSLATNIDYGTSFPLSISNGRAYIENRNSNLNRFVSLYANGAYTFSDKYTLSASARRDASNLFGVSTNNKWNMLWSAGFQWNISKDNFYRLEWLPMLKARITYGTSGNVDQSMAALSTIFYHSGLSPYTGHPTAAFNNYYNPDLRWETVRTLNFAIDFQTAGNRINGSVEYFMKEGTDLFGPDVLDYTGGVGRTITRNAAGMRANGLDVSLRTHNLEGIFKWDTDFFLNYYRDRITSYYLTNSQGSNFVNGNRSMSRVEGGPVYALLSYPWGGLSPDTGDPLGYFEDQITSDYRLLTGPDVDVSELTFHGPVYPKLFGGLGNTFRWKNISATVRIAYKFGHYFRRPALHYANLFALRDGHLEYRDRWREPGDENHTSVPSLVYPVDTRRDDFYTRSEITAERGDHVRLQYVNVSYRVDGRLLRTIPISAIEITAFANNLGIIWAENSASIDPDYPYMLPQKTFSLGINVSF